MLASVGASLLKTCRLFGTYRFTPSARPSESKLRCLPSMELPQSTSNGAVLVATHPGPAQFRRCRLLAFADNEWDGPWMNRQQLLSRLAKVHAVVYSNGLWSVWDRHRESFWASSWKGGYEERDGVWLDRPPKGLLSWPTHPAWDGAAARLGAAR